MHPETPQQPARFPETSWSLVQLCQDPDSPAFRAGLESLFRRYWGPVYRYICRNWSARRSEAKDLTQSFFLAFYEKNFIESVEADRGRFRGFVCAALQNFLRKEHRARLARKRRPADGLLSLDQLGAGEQAFDVPDARDADPREQFDADWRRAVLEAAMARLTRRAEAAGKSAVVTVFRTHDLDAHPAGGKPSHRELAERHGLTYNQVRNGLDWARKAYMECVLEELSEQVGSDADLRAEAAELFGL